MPKMCGFGKHPLKDGVLVTDPIYYPFIHKTRPDFRPDDEVCRICRNSMEHMYRKKKLHARMLRASRNGDVSTLSSNSMDSIDSLVYKTPQHQKLGKKDNDSSQSINTDQSELSGFIASVSSNSQSVNGIHEKTQNTSKKSGTNISMESVVQQSSNGSLEKAGRRSNESDISQENRSVMSISPGVSVATVIRKKVTFNEDVIIPEPASSRVTIELINRSKENVMSPTIYDEPADVQYFRDSLNVRLSQEPTTSAAAAAKPKGILQQSTSVVTSVTPKSRGIRDYFKALQVKGTSNDNSHISALRSINNNTSPGSLYNDATTAPTTKGRTDQTTTSSVKRPLNGNVDDSDDIYIDSDDDDPRMSLNYYNPNVRLPQYQPIPKRRQFHHKHDAVMNMYLQGINGG